MVVSEFKTKVLPVSNKLFRFAARILNNEEEARDVVQDIFLKLWQKRETLHEVENIEAFAMQMTRNRCLDLIRANRSVPLDIETKFSHRHDSLDIHTSIELTDSAIKIKTLIEELPGLQRNVMYMRDIEQLEYEEIAGMTGLNVNAVRVNLSRARKKVRDEFLKLNDDGNTKNKPVTATLF